MPDVGEHYRRTNEPRSPTHRVVGAADEVTLLRVTTPEGRRVHTGEIRYVPLETFDDEFEPVDDPDAGFMPVASVRNLAQGLYWSVRRFV